MPEYFLLDRAIIRLTPTDPTENVGGFLQGLVTNDVMDDGMVWAALLTPQGKVLFDFFVGPENTGDYLIDCEATQADALIKRLSLYRLRRKIAIARDPSLGVAWSVENFSASAPDPRHVGLGYRAIKAKRAGAEDGSTQFRTRRLSLGITEGIAELGSDQTLWLEANAAELNGVSFTKGCYIGQENTARMNWRQKVNRRMVVVPLSDADPKRQRMAYPELGLSVELRRVEDMINLSLPDWQRAAITEEANDPKPL